MNTKVLAALAVFVCCGVSLAVPPHARYADGLLSRTRPRGWLETACRAQREGLTGHPEALSYPYDSCLWAGEIGRSGNHGAGWWRYEQTAYYVDGLLRLGYALGDAELIAKGERNVDFAVEHADVDGRFGGKALREMRPDDPAAGFMLWPQAVFFRAMKAKYEATGDARIPALLSKFYRLYSVETLALLRNTVSVEGMLWTFGQTGDSELLARAEKAWADKRRTGDADAHSLTREMCRNDRPIYLHGVSYCEQLKVPLLLYAYTGKREYLDEAVKAEEKLERFNLLPDGAPVSVEETFGNSVYWGHETCDVSDFTWTLGYFLATTGDGRYADLIERCVFNAGFGAVDRPFKTLQYFSSVNQFVATCDSNHHPFDTPSRMQYRPTHETECCAGNVTRFLPNYVARMWLRDRAGDPVAALYGPSQVDLGWATVTEETRYPVDGRIAFRFRVREPGEHAFSFRTPGWCARGASAALNGVPCAEPLKRGAFTTVRRMFRDGDCLELDFPMDVTFEDLARRIYVALDASIGRVIVMKGPMGSQGRVVSRGPLLFAFAIPEERTEDTEEHPQMNGKKSANPDFKCWNLRPADPFGYALAGVSSDAKASVDASGDWLDRAHPAVTVDVKARAVRWELEDGKTSDIPETLESLSSEDVTLRLVPYGATQLRLAAFPVWGERMRR